MTDKNICYSKFSHICVPQSVYSMLENSGQIPKGICGLPLNVPSQRILSYHPIAFLQDSFEGFAGYYAMFFKNFMVICATDKGENVLPVAIPLTRIKSATIFVNHVPYGLTSSRIICAVDINFITDERFDNSFRGEISWYNDIYSKYIHQNSSGEVNKLLLHTNPRSEPIFAEAELNIIANKINELISNCTDFEKRETTIINLFKDPSIRAHLMENLYLPDEEFILLLCQYINELKQILPNETLITKLENFKNQKNKFDPIISDLKNKESTLNANIIKKEIEFLEISPFHFIKKIKKHDELVELKEELSKIKKQTSNTYIPNNECISIINLLNENGMKHTSPELEVEKQTIRKKKIIDTIKYTDFKEKAKIIGYEKYLNPLYQKMNAVQDELIKYIKTYNLGAEQATVTAQTADWAIIGGVADAIAGPVAGLISAAQTQQRNEQAIADAAKARSDGSLLMAYSVPFINEKKNELCKITARIDTFKSKQCDINNSDKLFQHLKYNVKSYTVLPSGCMKISIETTIKGSIHLNDISALLDGSLKVNIYHEDILVGDAYICAPGFDNYELDKAGFKNCQKFKTIGIKSDGGEFSSEHNYTFEILPENLWVIEK